MADTVEVTYEEEYKTSRAIEFTKDAVNQTIVLFFKGDFFGAAEQFESGLYNDDVIMLQSIYPYLPMYYLIPFVDETSIILALSQMKLEQVNDSTWKATLTYSLPENGGKSGGGMGTNVDDIGPDTGENDGAGWSENFTQLSVNMTAITRNRKWSLNTIACQRNVNLPPGGVPYPAGQPAPIGHTVDGIEGADVYERQFQFQITAYFPPEKLKYAYIRKLALMQTTYNRDVFFGFPPGSVLFLECNLAGDIYQVVPVTFSFQQQNNFRFSQTEATRAADPYVDDWLQMHDVFYEPEFEDTGIMPGWSYVDYRYAPEATDASKMVVQKPMLRTIHRLYWDSDFNAFEL